MTLIGLLSPRRETATPLARLAPPAATVVLVHETALPGIASDSLAALLVPSGIDQRLFAGHRPWIERFLAGGGTLVFNGLLAYPFLPDLRPFQPLPRRGRSDLQVRIVARHPIYEGVEDDDLTYRRGVAGFYGRGANPPPPGALVLATVGDGAPMDWEWQRPGGGRLLMHAGNDLWMYWDDPTSAARMARQLLDWCLMPETV